MDRQLRRDLVADVRAFVKELGIPLIHVTHQRNEARALGDRVILLDKGRIAKQGGAPRSILPQETASRDAVTFEETPLGDLAPRPERGSVGAPLAWTVANPRAGRIVDDSPGSSHLGPRAAFPSQIQRFEVRRVSGTSHASWLA